MNSLKVVSELVCLPLSAHSLEGCEPRAAGRKEGGPAAWATGVFFLTQSPSSEANRREDHGEAFLPSLPPSPPLLPHSFLHGGSGIRQAAEAVPRGAGTLRAVFVPQHFVTRSTSTESPLCSTHCCSPLDTGSLWERQVSVHGCRKCPLTENFHTDATLRFGENDQLGRDLTGRLGIVGQSPFLLPLLAGGSSGSAESRMGPPLGGT